MAPPAGPRAVGDDEFPATRSRKQRSPLPQWVRITAVLLGAASVPGGVLTGIVPWGLRTAGLAMQKDVDAGIAAMMQARQTADALEAKAHEALKVQAELQTKTMKGLERRVNAIDAKLSKRLRVPVTPATPVTTAPAP